MIPAASYGKLRPAFEMRRSFKPKLLIKAAPRFELDKDTIFSSFGTIYGVKTAKVTPN